MSENFEAKMDYVARWMCDVCGLRTRVYGHYSTDRSDDRQINMWIDLPDDWSILYGEPDSKVYCNECDPFSKQKEG